MELSNEDSLRLNVLLNQALEAVRIDESKMIIYGLLPQGEAQVQLNPNCRDDQYIKGVKEVISTHVLGSPGGYPIYLRRWTRMGQARDASLERLLKLGEPEAVVAVVHAAGLTDVLARCAWWAMPNSVNARCMLAKHEVAAGQMGKVLAEFLLEFLPFEEDPRDMIESVRLVLQPDLIDAKARESLWSRGQRKNIFLVGFLKTTPDDLPETVVAHADYPHYQQVLAELSEAGNPVAWQLLRVLSPQGQMFIKTVNQVLHKPANQDVVLALLGALEQYFTRVRPATPCGHEMAELLLQAQQCCQTPEASTVVAVLTLLPEAETRVAAMLLLSLLGVHVVNPIFAQTDAMGTVMRRKLEPVSMPLLLQLSQLHGASQ